MYRKLLSDLRSCTVHVEFTGFVVAHAATTPITSNKDM